MLVRIRVMDDDLANGRPYGAQSHPTALAIRRHLSSRYLVTVTSENFQIHRSGQPTEYLGYLPYSARRFVHAVNWGKAQDSTDCEGREFVVEIPERFLLPKEPRTGGSVMLDEGRRTEPAPTGLAERVYGSCEPPEALTFMIPLGTPLGQLVTQLKQATAAFGSDPMDYVLGFSGFVKDNPKTVRLRFLRKDRAAELGLQLKADTSEESENVKEG